MNIQNDECFVNVLLKTYEGKKRDILKVKEENGVETHQALRSITTFSSILFLIAFFAKYIFPNHWGPEVTLYYWVLTFLAIVAIGAFVTRKMIERELDDQKE